MSRVLSVLVCTVALVIAGATVNTDMLASASGEGYSGQPTSTNRLATAISAGHNLAPVSEIILLPTGTDAVDTLHWDGPNADAVGFTEGGKLYAAARFTPDEDFSLKSILWFNFNAGSASEVRVWGPGTATQPGTLLETITSTSGEEQWINVATPPIELPAGQDFWVGAAVTHTAGQFPIGVDAGPGVADRGGFYSSNGTAWRQLRIDGLDVNWNVRAIVETATRVPNDVGVRGILAPTGTITPGSVSPRVEIRNFGENPQSNIPVHIKVVQGGAEVYTADATYAGPLAPGANANVTFSPDWNATDGNFTVTSWTALAGDENPANDTARGTVNVTGAVTDTLRWYTGDASNAIGLTEGGTFYGAARFTPEMDYALSKVFWYNFNQATSAEVIIYGPGSASAPGSQLETITSGVGEEQMITVETPPVNLPSGQDFWVAIKVTHTRATYPLGVDAGPAVRGRGAFISMDGRAWDELWEVAPSLDFNWVIAAVVQSGDPGGVETELQPVGPASFFHLGPNPATGGMTTLRYNLPQAGPATVNVFDVTGRNVLSRSLTTTQTGTTGLDLRELSAGVYLVQLETADFSARQKLVVQQ